MHVHERPAAHSMGVKNGLNCSVFSVRLCLRTNHRDQLPILFFKCDYDYYTFLINDLHLRIYCSVFIHFRACTRLFCLINLTRNLENIITVHDKDRRLDKFVLLPSYRRVLRPTA